MKLKCWSLFRLVDLPCIPQSSCCSHAIVCILEEGTRHYECIWEGEGERECEASMGGCEGDECCCNNEDLCNYGEFDNAGLFNVIMENVEKKLDLICTHT
jgi:hypothetical protein